MNLVTHYVKIVVLTAILIWNIIGVLCDSSGLSLRRMIVFNLYLECLHNTYLCNGLQILDGAR